MDLVRPLSYKRCYICLFWKCVLWLAWQTEEGSCPILGPVWWGGCIVGHFYLYRLTIRFVAPILGSGAILMACPGRSGHPYNNTYIPMCDVTLTAGRQILKWEGEQPMAEKLTCAAGEEEGERPIRSLTVAPFALSSFNMQTFGLLALAHHRSAVPRCRLSHFLRDAAVGSIAC